MAGSVPHRWDDPGDAAQVRAPLEDTKRLSVERARAIGAQVRQLLTADEELGGKPGAHRASRFLGASAICWQRRSGHPSGQVEFAPSLVGSVVDQPIGCVGGGGHAGTSRERQTSTFRYSLRASGRDEARIVRVYLAVPMVRGREAKAVMKTIRELREERGESQHQLASVLGATLSEVADLESGVARPSVQRLRLLTEHFGVREDEINLEPYRPPTVGEQLRDALTE
jgi:ribosome-binding protein aMBF1 (putative translation factor)